MTTEIQSNKEHISILEDFQHFLSEVWKNDKKRDWSFYSAEESRYFWDKRETPK